MKEFIEYIVKHLVDQPENVVIEEEARDENKIVIRLKVAPSDIGKVIGKKGRTAIAIRTIGRAAGKKLGKIVSVNIQD